MWRGMNHPYQHRLSPSLNSLSGRTALGTMKTRSLKAKVFEMKAMALIP
ncbi:hypothetical protein TIFTF001_017750 [Ficus carica]|uniref:Uncharacterized protein n=1 Tax=Ficus carica TaxID=3494 RepID=A0AA88AB84_FICCA|nr:hypothetical protein TIFTF001_017750 [Ficus carica]